MNRNQRRFSKAPRQAGFTLIEIMVVIVILGLLAAAIVPKLFGRVGQANMVKAQHDINALQGALSMYRLDNFNYPSTAQGLNALVSKPSGDPPANNWRQGYIERLPKDPWGNQYQYLSPGVKGEVDIFSYGRDGKPGGDGEDADIGNWGTEG